MKISFVNHQFNIGKVGVTEKADRILSSDAMGFALFMHSNGNFGNISVEDWSKNDEAIDKNSGRVVSIFYDSYSSENFMIITDLSESVTTILLPSEF